MAAGLAHLWGTPATDTTRVLLIIGITGMALASVVSGMERGVKRLSEVNLLLALLLLAFVLTVGPTRDIATDTVTSLGQYLATIGPLSNWVGREDLDFMHGWTIFFWAWWISWSPFVGLADVLARKRSRPTARGKDPDANFVRNRAIVDAVQWLVQQGFRATRSKAMAVASVEGGSACDAGRRQS